MAGSSGFGVQLLMSDMAATPVYTAIAEISDGPEGPSLSRDTIDTTSHDSPNGYREFVGSLRDGGEVSFGINWDSSDPTHDPTTGLIWAFNRDAAVDWRLIFPDPGAAQCDFAAVMTEFNPSSPLDDKISASITLKLTGAPTWS